MKERTNGGKRGVKEGIKNKAENRELSLIDKRWDLRKDSLKYMLIFISPRHSIEVEHNKFGQFTWCSRYVPLWTIILYCIVYLYCIIYTKTAVRTVTSVDSNPSLPNLTQLSSQNKYHTFSLSPPSTTPLPPPPPVPPHPHPIVILTPPNLESSRAREITQALVGKGALMRVNEHVACRPQIPRSCDGLLLQLLAIIRGNLPPVDRLPLIRARSLYLFERLDQHRQRWIVDKLPMGLASKGRGSHSGWKRERKSSW